MANFDMIPPDANELFGFNDSPGENLSKINWKWIAGFGILTIAVVLVIVSQRRKAQERKKINFSLDDCKKGNNIYPDKSEY